MKIVFYTNILSPHQLPWCQELVRICGEDNFRYIACEGLHVQRREMGWDDGDMPAWVRVLEGDTQRHALESELRNCEILLSGLRDVALLRERAVAKLPTWYMSERWFKPPLGMMRMLVPGYFRMCREYYRLVRLGDLRLLPIGVHAVRDMMRMLGVLQGNWRCLFKAPEISMGAMSPMAKVSGESCAEAMHLWGYFVQPAERVPRICESGTSRPVQILWCGRMLGWKRVDTLVKAAVGLLEQGENFRLRLVGHGPAKRRLECLAGKWLGQQEDESGICVLPPVPIQAVRGLMRDSDVVVLCSDSGEGWGAVVNEAMAEGCTVIGTHEAGSSATMIEHGVNGWLYPAGDVRKLSECLLNEIRRIQRGGANLLGRAAARTLSDVWSPAAAAQALWQEIQR